LQLLNEKVEFIPSSEMDLSCWLFVVGTKISNIEETI